MMHSANQRPRIARKIKRFSEGCARTRHRKKRNFELGRSVEAALAKELPKVNKHRLVALGLHEKLMHIAEGERRQSAPRARARERCQKIVGDGGYELHAMSLSMSGGSFSAALPSRKAPPLSSARRA